MEVKLLFVDEFKKRIAAVFKGDKPLNEQIQDMVINHVGQTELNVLRTKLTDAMKKENDERQKGIDEEVNAAARRITKELGIG